MAMEALVKERMERHANGEKLNDLFHPLLEDSKGDEPAITTTDRTAEREQAGKSNPCNSVYQRIMVLTSMKLALLLMAWRNPFQ